MSHKQMFSMDLDSSIDMLERIFKNFEKVESADQDRFVNILISKPGLGKSAAIAKMAKRMGYDLVHLNLAAIDATDILGLGAREKIDGKWITMPALPVWTQRALAGNCLLFIDEFNNTTQDVLAGFQTMFSDFVVDGIPLPRTTHIIGACNPPGKDAIYAAKKLSGAFRRRLCMLPIVDDFDYVMRKHSFVMPRGFMNVDYADIMEYCDYEDISSAVIDNIFNIYKYDNLTELEKLTLISGFGAGAYGFAREMKLFSAEALAAGHKLNQDEAIEYRDWKRDPGDYVSEYQQVLWGQESISNSSSYSRSKKFLSRVKNPSVYAALYSLLKDRFAADYELDETKLPEQREIS